MFAVALELLKYHLIHAPSRSRYDQAVPITVIEPRPSNCTSDSREASWESPIARESMPPYMVLPLVPAVLL